MPAWSSLQTITPMQSSVHTTMAASSSHYPSLDTCNGLESWRHCVGCWIPMEHKTWLLPSDIWVSTDLLYCVRHTLMWTFAWKIVTCHLESWVQARRCGSMWGCEKGLRVCQGRLWAVCCSPLLCQVLPVLANLDALTPGPYYGPTREVGPSQFLLSK